MVKHDIKGETFCCLYILDYSHEEKNKHFWKCLCLCGKELIEEQNKIRYGATRYCDECNFIDTIKGKNGKPDTIKPSRERINSRKERRKKFAEENVIPHDLQKVKINYHL